MNQFLSTSREFDRPEYYSFTRQSGIPYGTFGKSRRTLAQWFADTIIARPHRTVFWVCVVGGIVAAVML